MSDVKLNESPPGPDDLAKFARETTKKIDFLKRLNRLVAIAIALAFVFFGLLYFQYYRSYIVTDFMIGVNEEANKLVTRYSSSDSEIMQTLLPAYKNEFARISAQHSDEWLRMMKEELNNISTSVDTSSLLEQTSKETVTLIGDPERRTMSAVIDAFPHLKDPGKQKAACERLKAEMPEFLDALKGKYALKIQELDQTAQKCQNPDLPEDRDELFRIFLHNVLMTVDKELLAPPPAKAQASVTTSRKGGK